MATPKMVTEVKGMGVPKAPKVGAEMGRGAAPVPMAPKVPKEMARSAAPGVTPVAPMVPKVPREIRPALPVQAAPAAQARRTPDAIAPAPRMTPDTRPAGAIAPFAPSPLIQRDAAMRTPVPFFPMKKTDNPLG